MGLRSVAIILTLLFMLSACAGLFHKGPANIHRPYGESLKEAVNKYWNYRKAGNIEKCYDYEHTAYVNRMSRETYVANFRQGYVIKSFKILKIDKEGSGPKGTTPVEMVLEISLPSLGFPAPKEIKNRRKDYWIKEDDGRWYHMLPFLNNLY